MTSDPEFPETPEGMAPEGMAEDAKAFEDWEDAFIARNREAIGKLLDEARASLDRGDADTRTVDEIIAQGRARLAAGR